MEPTLLIEPMLVLRLEHALVTGRDATVVSALAEIMMRPCFAPLQRMAFETRRGRRMRHTTPSAEVIRAYLSDPQCDFVDMDAGRRREPNASARLPTGLVREHDYWVAWPAPLTLEVIVPHDPGLARARIDAFCDLAMAVQAIAGCVSMENGFRLARRVGFGSSFHPAKLVNRQPGMTMRRLRERRSFDMSKLDREVPAPEWGLFLSRGHLAVVPASALEASGVFHQVRRLGEDLVFLQLTADPADALRPDYDALLDPVRQVLAPILSPPSD
jgi:hypothetical protein